ncbi:MAG: MBL fold metallo-hydrolase [Paludibacteraceae bacterium]|nr:MBL fold metallo-hydrolase [Paludibacteraceae bacterium]
MQTKVFYFNPYRECTYVLHDEERHAVIIDAGMLDEREQQRFADYIRHEQLTPVALLITHTHPDHVCGQEWIESTYRLKAVVFPEEGTLPVPDFSERIEVLRTPGHKEDCVCYHLPEQGLLFSGDTLFEESIGRTDLPGGDMHLLLQSLSRLTTLPDDTRVLPGHGYPTTIAHERQYNPYLGH